MFSTMLPLLGNQIEMTGSGVLGSDVFSGGKRPLLRYWWNTSALGDALSASPRPAPLERTTIAWWSGTLSGPSELPSEPNAVCVIDLICPKSALALPCDGMVALNSL